MNNQQPATNHRSLTGFVTKLVGDGATYGFINDEIFFQQTSVAGGPAGVGDQVFAECEYSANLPIKWNATTVKIINKASGGHQHTAPNPGTDRQQQQQQQQQDLMVQQQQQQQSSGVAVTYQQHRQQRQQRQMMDVKQHDNGIRQQQQQTDLTARLLDQTNNPGGEYFGVPGNVGPYSHPQQPQQQQPPPPHQQQQQPQQQQDGNIQPFQEQPMGPPNLLYTSQLGSAFVQSPFAPAPFLAQQPPPSMLPQQQPQQQPQHLLPNNNQIHNQNNQRHNQHNKGMGGRFNNNNNNNHVEKNDRHQNNNSNRRNRNDNNKFDRPRSEDRDGSHNQNRGSSKSNDSRDRSTGRGGKRDDVAVRPSPPPHSSARSSASITSDRGTKSSRRHYEVQNIPKTQIMTNMNAYNMKQRCPSSVHVPSDLKDIIVNRYFRLDIKNTPKPLEFTIEQPKKEQAPPKDEGGSGSKVEQPSAIEPSTKEEPEETSVATMAQENSIEQDNESVAAAVTVAPVVEKVEPKLSNEPSSNPSSSKSDLKMSHKYGVKVILISLPELETIYSSVFGPNLDSFNSENKSHSKLDEVISLLCNKGSNNGHSLIGGKFDPSLDGFVEGETNEFERHGRQPDLIATCKRIVLEQTGLDLANCRSWSLLSTFMYNHKSDYFSPQASIEYSFIYLPQIWTMLSESFDKNIVNIESSDPSAPINTPVVESSESTIGMEVQDTDEALPGVPEVEEDQGELNNISSSVSNEAAVATVSLDNLSDLKVADLKAELDKREIKYKGTAKKAELISLLQDCLAQSDQAQIESQEKTEGVEREDSTTADAKAQDVQLEEGEVVEASVENSPSAECDGQQVQDSKPEPVGKRKIGAEAETDEPMTKKVCAADSPVKEQRVTLIKESFVVRARDDQQQFSLVSLHEATQASRYDQFELSVASNILKESLIQHLSEYIMTALIEDNRQKITTSSSQSSSSQETSSDTNNNSTKSAFKNPVSSAEHKINLKELPVDRYINLAFSYFDSSHMGYVYFDDLNKLFNNTGLTISKRALISLVGDGEKFNYRTLPDLSPKLSPTYVYEFPQQFNRLGGLSSISNGPNLVAAGKTIEYKGVTYDVEKLIQQVRDAETMRVSLVDRFNFAIENSDKQAEEIHVLEVSQKSLAKAIKAQNDEICELKRERDSIKKKFESIRKGVKGTVSSLSELVKDEK